MASRTANHCMEANDPHALAAWWDEAVDDFTLDAEARTSDHEVALRGPLGRWLVFVHSDEPKRGVNRVYFCLRPTGCDQASEVERLTGLGATVLKDARTDDGGHVVMADPEGNEFLLLATPAEDMGITNS